ncbi:conjugative transposon protein TraN [Taibaiella chishuiensis]|uniref:Conjugative transposon TraN protein n=1 Tax=Taibaiella chishuiensis TaxID=1434707 RepID=A0A2P8D0N7_9BACT|nr:conjugative transposon protein TraN [Taibaiella chishuiensis]PSK90775.1 conjugative transposon TraN protein [Taibaiella chishuiensis]
MRKISAVWISFIILFITQYESQAQSLINGVRQSTIASFPLTITFSKTTNLMFPYPIKSVDKGSKDVLVQIAKGVENILQVKAAKQGFAETNLTVVTSDGKLYSYLLNYSDFPAALNIKVGQNINYPGSDALFTYKSDNEAKVHDITEQIASKKPVIKNIRDSRYEVAIFLHGVYIKDDKLYFQFRLENNSNVDYSAEAIRFFIKDKKKSKRTSTQEIELSPVQVAGNTEIIRGQSSQNFVVALPKFTVPDKKLLCIELQEQNGGRHLGLKIQNKTIVAAKAIR